MRWKLIITREGYGILQHDGMPVAAGTDPYEITAIAIHAAAGADEPALVLHPN